MSAGLRSRRIDLIRGISILLVLFHHFAIVYRLDDTVLARILGWDTVRAVARNGNYGVTMFFVVSGFLITSNARRRGAELGRIHVRSFYGRRAARILPCLLLLLVVVDGLGLAGFRAFQNAPPDGSAIAPVSYGLSHLAALTSWMNVLIARDGWFNYPLGVLWSLSVEEAFYLTFPLACIVLRTEVRLAAFWVVFIVLGPAWRFSHQGSEGGWLYAYFACFDGIAIGCCAALLVGRVRLPSILAIPAATSMAFLYLCAPIAETNIFGVSLMAAGTAILLLGSHLAPNSPILAGGRVLGALACFGRLSYELYLFHLVVLAGMRTLWPARAIAADGKMLLLAGYVVLSTIIAGLIVGMYSDPLNRRLRRLLVTGAGSQPEQAAVR